MTAPKKKRGSTKMAMRRAAFAVHYAETLNATQAAKLAGYAHAGAHVQGAALLAEDDVVRMIDKRRREMAQAGGASAQRVIDALCRVAFADLREMFNEIGEIRPPSEWTEAMAGAIVEYTPEGKHTPPKLKLSDRLAALRMLGEHLGLFRQKMELSGPDGGPVEMRNLTDQQLVALIAAKVEIGVSSGG